MGIRGVRTKGALASAPKLEGWLTPVDIAERHGVSRQYVHRIADEGAFGRHVRRVGPLFVVREAEVERWAAKRGASA